MSITFSGHTPVRQPIQAERQIYIDTSAVYHYLSQNKSVDDCLTFAYPAEQVLFKFSMVNKTLEVVPFEDIERYCQ